MWLLVGLGNPGKEYASHRHNVGFHLLDELEGPLRCDAYRSKWKAEWAKGRAPSSGDDVVLLKPQTFMNLSGESVQPCAAFFKVSPKEILVVHDELDLPFGKVQLKMGGGHAGHNGLRSIIGSLGTPDFARLRIGIGRPPPGFRGQVADYVLSGFDTSERAELTDILRRGADSVLDVLARGFTPAMNTLHAPLSSAKSASSSAKKTIENGDEKSVVPPRSHRNTGGGQ